MILVERAQPHVEFCLVKTDAANRTKLKQSLSCSMDSSTVGSPLGSPKCNTTLHNSAHFVEFNTSSFSSSLLSPSSSSEVLVTSQHAISYSSSPMAASSFTSLPTSSLNSPSAVFSSCMFPEIPVFSPTDSALASCRTAHVPAPASDSAYVGCSDAAEAELTSGDVNESGGVAGNMDEGCDSMSSTSLKRSLSGTCSDDEIMSRSSKTTRSDRPTSRQHTERLTGALKYFALSLSQFHV